MLYLNDEVKDDFSKAVPLLMVICSYLEFEAARYNAQIELFQYYDNCAIVQMDASFLHEVENVCAKVNSLFMRKRSRMACVISDEENFLIKVIATEASDLEYLI